MSQQTASSGFSTILPIEQQYPTILYVICPILITYFSIYVMLRNHYIFKPRLQMLFKRNQIKSFILQQIIIDIFSSLSILTFIFSSLVLSSSDLSLELILHNDLYWLGICMSILAYRNLKQEEMIQMKVVVKNALFLLTVYVLIAYQYFSKFSFLLMGFLFMALYFINIIFKVNQQKFVTFIQDLFDSKHQEISNHTYNHVNYQQSPQYLSSNFPVSKQQIQQRLQIYQPALKRLKLKTKVAVTKKMLILALAVRLSQQKMINKMKKDVGAYYGGLNGTTNQKVKRLQYQNKNTLAQENQNINSKENMNSNNIKSGSINQEDIVLTNILSSQAEDWLQFLFTIFPIKIFQSSAIISILFTLSLNLTFGICLDYTLQITSTIQFGKFLNCLYALLILPVLPQVSKTQFFNSMCLSALWRYFLIGLFLCINIGMNGDGNLRTSNILQIQSILVSLLIVYVLGYLLSGSKNQYKIPVVFALLFCTNLGVTYYGQSHRT